MLLLWTTLALAQSPWDAAPDATPAPAEPASADGDEPAPVEPDDPAARAQRARIEASQLPSGTLCEADADCVWEAATGPLACAPGALCELTVTGDATLTCQPGAKCVARAEAPLEAVCRTGATCHLRCDAACEVTWEPAAVGWCRGRGCPAQRHLE